MQKWRDGADFVLKAVAIVAIVLGMVAAYYRFGGLRAPDASMQLSISTEVLPYSDEARLLVVHARPRNTGTTSVELGKAGFPVSVVSLPNNLKAGTIDVDNELAKAPLKYKVDILSRFPGGYVIDPGFEYDELFVVVVPPGLYAVSGSLGFDIDSELDRTEVVIVR